MKRNLANLITSFRVFFSISLLFFPAFSTAFFVLYIAAGITDVIDGIVARKTKTESDFGAKLDTTADFVFFAVCLIKLIPVLNFKIWMYAALIVVAVIKAVNIISGFVMFKKFVAVHTVMNKVTGVLLFALPLATRFVDLKYCAIPVIAAALFAAVQEGHFIRTGRWKEEIEF